jgi:GDPmannose 4,6-dehydratase
LGMQLRWEGQGADEKGYWVNSDRPELAAQPIVAIDPRYFRPAEVATLLGDARKAREKLGWAPRIGFGQLVAEMASADLNEAQRDQLVRSSGYPVFPHHE